MARTYVNKGSTCVYDESKDGRRGHKRTLNQLYTKGEALDTLLEVIDAKSWVVQTGNQRVLYPQLHICTV